MQKISIDLRTLQLSVGRGMGRYVENLLTHVYPIAPPDSLVLLFDPKIRTWPLQKFSGSLPLTPFTQFPPRVGHRAHPFLRYFDKTSVERFPTHVVHFTGQEVLPPTFGSKTAIVTIHDIIPFAMRKHHFNDLLGPLTYSLDMKHFRNIFRAAKKMIAVSKYTKQDLMQHFGVPGENIRVIYEGISPHFQPPGSDGSSPVSTRIERPYVLYVGELGYRKNIQALIRVFCDYLDRLGPKLDLVLVAGGDKPGMKTIQKFLKRNPHAGNIRIFAQVSESELVSLYQNCLAFVFPSIYEGFGFPPLEAMACAAPVLSSNATCLPEILGDAALLFDSEDISDFSKKFSRIMEDATLRKELAHKGRERSQHFTWEKTAKETLEIYEEVAK